MKKLSSILEGRSGNPMKKQDSLFVQMEGYVKSKLSDIFDGKAEIQDSGNSPIKSTIRINTYVKQGKVNMVFMGELDFPDTSDKTYTELDTYETKTVGPIDIVVTPESLESEESLKKFLYKQLDGVINPLILLAKQDTNKLESALRYQGIAALITERTYSEEELRQVEKQVNAMNLNDLLSRKAPLDTTMKSLFPRMVYRLESNVSGDIDIKPSDNKNTTETPTQQVTSNPAQEKKQEEKESETMVTKVPSKQPEIAKSSEPAKIEPIGQTKELKFKISIIANNSKDVIKGGYSDILKSILKDLGVSSFSVAKGKDGKDKLSDVEIHFDVGVNSLVYPDMLSFDSKFYPMLDKELDTKKIDTVLVDESHNQKDVDGNPYVGLQYVVDHKVSLAGAVENLAEARRANDKIESEIKAQKEQQKVKASPVTSVVETDLQNKAIKPQQEKTQPVVPSVVIPPSNVEKASPVTMTPVIEKSTTNNIQKSSSEKVSSEKTVSQTSDSKLSEKTIQGGTKEQSVESTINNIPIVPSVLGGTSPESSEEISKQDEINQELKKEIESHQGISTLISDLASARTDLTSKSETNTTTREQKTMVPSDYSKRESTVSMTSDSQYASNENKEKQSDKINQSIVKTESIVDTFASTVNNMANVLQNASEKISKDFGQILNTISKTTENTQIASGKIEKSENNVSRDGLIASNVSTEKSSRESTNLNRVQDRIVNNESAPPLDFTMSEVSRNIGDNIRNAMTNTTINDVNMVSGGQTNSSSLTQGGAVSTTSSDQSQNNQTSLEGQSNNMALGGRNSSPSVVSLSQSTIDNLASAIIRNMTVTPFLNSGRYT